jgi:hypothetical protein
MSLVNVIFGLMNIVGAFICALWNANFFCGGLLVNGFWLIYLGACDFES